MDFIDQLKQFSKRVEGLKDTIQTEEATKTSIIMPFFSLLGYDVFNPEEFLPEFTADVGIKKGEKVDYAVMSEGSPVILIEAKWIGEPLNRHDSQLFRYFGTTKAKFAILTNGLIYRFYTDLEETNKMDEVPFLEINILDIKETQVSELKKFHKSTFNINDIFDTASELKYSNEFKNILSKQLQTPSDDFIKLFLTDTYTGVKTQGVIEKFRPILKKALNNYISEIMNDKIKSALGSAEDAERETENEIIEEAPVIDEPKIITTTDELEAYFIIKNILKESVPIQDIVYKDNEKYMVILYKNNVSNWVCRLYFSDSKKCMAISDENKKEVRYTIDNVYEIENFKDQLLQSLGKYI